MKGVYNMWHATIRCLSYMGIAIWVGFIAYVLVESAPIATDISSFIGGTDWYPLGEQYGLLYIIGGSLYVSVLAMILAALIGIGSAIALACSVPAKWRDPILASIDMVAGIPSVIFGFIGLTVVVPFVAQLFALSSGESVLAASFILSIMTWPYIITHCTVSIMTHSARYIPAASQLGISKWYTLQTIVLPQALPSMGTSCMLAFARALGETMAVMMVIGNAPILPTLLGKGTTIPGLIALEMGSVEYDSMHYHSLYGAAVVLMLLLSSIRWFVHIVPQRMMRKQTILSTSLGPVSYMPMLCYMCLAIVLLTLVGIIGWIVVKGAMVVSLDFLTTYPSGTPLGTTGGIWPAIIGTLLEGSFTALWASLRSIPSALYLTFGGMPRRWHSSIIGLLETMSGVPSIVMGLFGYSILILYGGLSKSLLTALLTLGLMIMPLLTLRMVKVFSDFPKPMYVAAQNMGLSESYIWFRLVIPYSLRSMTTTIELGAAYAMGATAPILYTGVVLYTRTIPDLTDPFMALPYHLYMLVNEGYGLDMAYGTAFVLMVMLFSINIVCRLITRRS